MALLFALPAWGEVAFDWATVDDPGNACDSQVQGCFGSTADPYQISKFEVVNADYTEFLNAVATTDSHSLYNTSMGVSPGGITRSGSAGSFSYSAIAGREDMPVNYVSFWDATRFANWLHNGQPTGAQDDTTTENGAYRLTPTAMTNNSVTRNTGARAFITSEDEWYRAAYYDTTGSIYFDYPAASDTQTTCTVPGAIANTANCGFASGELSNVGSHTGAASPSGTFDQGGNVYEMNEAILGASRSLRGGTSFSPASTLAASFRSAYDPQSEAHNVGFRVARPVPPLVPSLNLLGMIAAGGFLLLAGWLRLRPHATRV